MQLNCHTNTYTPFTPNYAHHHYLNVHIITSCVLKTATCYRGEQKVQYRCLIILQSSYNPYQQWWRKFLSEGWEADQIIKSQVAEGLQDTVAILCGSKFTKICI